MYDWSAYFEDKTVKTALNGITQMHHFKFPATHPGRVFVKNTNDGPEREITLKKVDSWQPLSSDLPDEIVPPGLSLERQWYLHNKIHEFCPAHCSGVS